MDSPEIIEQLSGLFDNPPPAIPMQDPSPVAAAWDQDDDQFVENLVNRADTPAEELDPAEIVGERQWKQMVSEDPVFGGLKALETVQAEWNWNMTRGQRARTAADVAFGSRIGSLIDGFTKSAVRKFPDPFDYAAEVTAKRRM